MTHVKTRLAPTPSGYLHLGNVFSFAIAWALARKENGQVALRIDNLYNMRFRPEYVQDIFDTLHFMGLDYDEGPRTLDEFYKLESLQVRKSLSEDIFSRLIENNLLYSCTCSRSQIAYHRPSGLYSRTCSGKKLPLIMEDAAWRLRIQEETLIDFEDALQGHLHVELGKYMPDFIVRRKDHMPSYQIASLCDDIQMGCNLIVRGEDLIPSTAAQLHLAHLIGNISFTESKFVHHKLIVDPFGEKLAKSQDAPSLHEMRKKGQTLQTSWSIISQLLGWKEPILDSKSFLDRFDLASLSSYSLEHPVFLFLFKPKS